MNFYTEPVRLTEPVWNNAIAYSERMALWSQGKLYVPALIDWTLDDLAVWENIVFEEIDHGSLISCKGLKNLLTIHHQWKTIYITDNHNHALYFRYEALTDGLITPGATLLHIDQHADFSEPNSYLNAEIKEQKAEIDLSAVVEYVNTQTQIASFIKPALQSWLLKECVQIRSEAKLQHIAEDIKLKTENNTEVLGFESWVLNYILDIDMDFFAHETDVSAKIELIRQLISSASVVTIATSPYFMDQQRAISLIKELFVGIDK